MPSRRRDALWLGKYSETNEMALQFLTVAMDPIVGRYFVDHLSKRNLLDDPRSAIQSKEHFQFVTEALKSTEHEMIGKKQTLRLKKDELSKLIKGLKKMDDDHEHELKQREVQELEHEIQQQSNQVQQVNEVLQALSEDAPSQLERQVQIQSEINDLQFQLDHALACQDAAMEDLHKLGTQLQGQKTKPTLESLKMMIVQVGGINTKLTSPPPKEALKPKPALPAHLQPRLRIEREMDRLALKRRLEYTLAETEKLVKIANSARLEIEKALALAISGKSSNEIDHNRAWIKLLNEYSSKSETIRRQARENQKEAVENGQVQDFRAKVLFFTSAPLAKLEDSSEKKLPGKLKK